MSLYNMIRGVNPATFFVLPIIAERHPETYPRFRDCFIGEASNDWNKLDQFGIPQKKQDTTKRVVSIYTRVGGGNRPDYAQEIAELRRMPGYIRDFDDDFDPTFATFVFAIPPKFERDYDLILEGKLTETSEPYRKRIYATFPKLKEIFDEIFEAP